MFSLVCVESMIRDPSVKISVLRDDVVSLNELGKDHPYETLSILFIIQKRLNMIGYSLRCYETKLLSDSIYILKSKKSTEGTFRQTNIQVETISNAVYCENAKDAPLFTKRSLVLSSSSTDDAFAAAFLREAKVLVPGIDSPSLDFIALFECLDERTKEQVVIEIASKIIRYLIITFDPSKGMCNNFYVPASVLSLLFQCAAKCCAQKQFAVKTNKRLHVIASVNGNFPLLLKNVRERNILAYPALTSLSFAVVITGNYSIGPHTFECTTFVAALQLIFPDSVILLRGIDDQRVRNGDWSICQDTTLFYSCGRYIKNESALPITEYINLYSVIATDGKLSERYKTLLKECTSLILWEQMNLFFDNLSFAVYTPDEFVINGLPTLVVVLTCNEFIKLINMFDKPLEQPQNNYFFREILMASYSEKAPKGREIFVPSKTGDSLVMTKNALSFNPSIKLLCSMKSDSGIC